jgi:flagellar biosynthesis component FlhA
MGQAYGLVRDRVGAGATPLIETAIELSLGERWADLASGDLIGVRIGELRDSLSAETGVRIPGMLVSPDTRLPSDAALVSIYGEVVGSADAVVGREPGMDELLRVLRDSLQSNMYRLVANDDVDLWAIGWDGAAGVTGADIDSLIPTEREARARLGWVLRSLLHERVPITERTRISEAFARYEDGQQATRADALAAVRTALYPAVCGPHAPDDAVSLRDDLLSRLHEGCDTRSEDGWELPRDAAIELLSDIRAWAQSPPDVGTLIRVDDSRCRRVLWRLLAAERPRVFVIATEEMP